MIEKEIFADCYKLFQKYYNTDPSPLIWSNLIEEASEIEKKHQDPFCVKLLKVVLDRLVELADSKKIGGETK